jgi:hypothetical protein
MKVRIKTDSLIKAEPLIKLEIKNKPFPPAISTIVRRYKSGTLISASTSASTSAAKRSGIIITRREKARARAEIDLYNQNNHERS